VADCVAANQAAAEDTCKNAADNDAIAAYSRLIASDPKFAGAYGLCGVAYAKRAMMIMRSLTSIR